MPRFLGMFIAVLLLCACSPLARLELRFAYAGPPLDPALFLLTGKKTCPPGPVAAPAPLAPAALALSGSRNDASWQQVTAQAPGLHVITAFRGSRCRVKVTGFYDANRDGRVSVGDLVATSAEIEVSDRGLFSGNLTVGPVLRFTPIR